MSQENVMVEIKETGSVAPLGVAGSASLFLERTCRTCRHFDQDGTPFPTWGHCKMAKGSGDAPVQFETKAYAVDVEGYGARLNVAPDFSCNQFEAK